MEIQELISRGRLIVKGAPKRLEVFKLVNGKRGAKDIAKQTGRGLSSTLQDLQKMKNMGLIEARTDNDNRIIKKHSSTVFQKVPLLRHIPLTYFQDPVKANKSIITQRKQKKSKNIQLKKISTPSQNMILDICKTGESQLYEFKRAGTEARKLAKEICAFANTKMGGVLFYGIEDDGTISGSDKHRQSFDQSIQNSIKNTISPQIIIEIKEKDLLGQKILLIIIPPWNKKEIYYHDGRCLIRKGTNVFVATADEIKKLHRGEYIL